jgi:hypothetical protein
MAVASTVQTLESLRSLSSADLLSLWGDLDAPAVDEMNGEYDGAFVPPVSIRHAELRKTEGPGEWFAKAFSPEAHGAHPGQGYNIWFTPRRVIRCIRFATETGPSPLDRRPALLLHYGAFRHHNTSTGMLNEVRRVEAGLYVAVTTATVETETFGAVDPATGRSKPEPFVLRGPVGPWVGVDDPQAELPN